MQRRSQPFQTRRYRGRGKINRCLSPLVAPVRFNVEEIFHPTTEIATGRPLRVDEYEGDVDDLDDAALLIDDKHILDIREVVRQNIWLALPMYGDFELELEWKTTIAGNSGVKYRVPPGTGGIVAPEYQLLDAAAAVPSQLRAAGPRAFAGIHGR